MPASGTSSWMPALCTRICGTPSANTRCSAASVPAMSVRSQVQVSAEPPAAQIAATTISAASMLACACTITCIAFGGEAAADRGAERAGAAGDQRAPHAVSAAPAARSWPARSAIRVRRSTAAGSHRSGRFGSLQFQLRRHLQRAIGRVVQPRIQDLDRAQGSQIAGRLHTAGAQRAMQRGSLQAVLDAA